VQHVQEIIEFVMEHQEQEHVSAKKDTLEQIVMLVQLDFLEQLANLVLV